jgi:hypothetical protein
MRQPICHLRSEAEYSHQLDSELINSMRSQAESQEHRLRLEEASQIHKPELIEALEKLGFDDTTVMLLFVVPLVQVAWADGAISPIERDHIMAIAALRGVESNTPAHRQLMAWLDRQPQPEFFEGTLKAIEGVLSSLLPTERKSRREALLLCCRDAAAAPCHFFGWLSRVCAAKRKAIEEIAMRLGPK